MSGFCSPGGGGGAVATLDPTQFTTGGRYPEFSTVSSGLLTDYYAEAGDYLNNTGLSPITDPLKTCWKFDSVGCSGIGCGVSE